MKKFLIPVFAIVFVLAIAIGFNIKKTKTANNGISRPTNVSTLLSSKKMPTSKINITNSNLGFTYVKSTISKVKDTSFKLSSLKYPSDKTTTALQNETAESLKALSNTILNNTKSKASLSEINAINTQNNIWMSYIKNILSASIKTESKTHIQGVFESEIYEREMANYAIFNTYNYTIDNGTNPQFNMSFLDTMNNLFYALSPYGKKINLTGNSLKFFNFSQNLFKTTEEKSNLILNTAIKNKTSLKKAYTSINTLWNSSYNELYKTIEKDIKSGVNFKTYNTPFTNFKKQMISSQENILSKNRLSVRLTQLEFENLVNTFTNSIGYEA